MTRAVVPMMGAFLAAVGAAGVALGLMAQPVGSRSGAESVIQAQQADQPTAQPAAQPASQPAAQAESLIRFGVAAPPARHKGAIRLATYNTENLFDAIDDPNLSGANEDIDDAKPEAQVKALAATIRKLDADVIALEEVESEAVVTWFRDTYLADAGYTFLASVEAGDERGIEQAVLSRFPIKSVKNWPHMPLEGTHPAKWGSGVNYHAGEPITFHRSPLRVVIEVPSDVTGGPAYDLTLFAIHAKSGGPGEYWRQAEADGLVKLLTAEMAANPKENIALLGDFNAILSDGSVQTLVGAGFHDALRDVYEPGARFTSHESGRRIDYILVNDNLAAEEVPGSGFVLGTPALPEGADWREPWRPDGYASDHYPVAIEIRPVEAASH
ncbi:MAG: endonuclease/exonuclease/phosphatase family protein [Phycisphaerales bacterium]|nr:endonuclease/exonuclease/phosphatase family protein [Phycisphaerales bacterium]